MNTILQTPSVNRILPLSPSADSLIRFYYTDSQPVKNRAIITDNATGDIVYDQTEETRTLTHTVPAGTLTAGNTYLIRIQVFDVNGNSSNLSEPALFHCFTSPVFEFRDLSDKSTTCNANITPALNYVQEEGEPLKCVEFFKYSADQTVLTRSPVIYSQNPSYEFHTLQNNTTYYFRAVGETKHGMQLDTGYIEVTTRFETIPANIVFTVDNIYSEGYIQFTSNIIIVDYELENGNYTLEDGLLTLWDNSLTYSGFSAKDDFILFVEAKKLPLGKPFLSAGGGALSLSVIEVCGSYFCKLSVKDSNYSLYAPFPVPVLATSDGSFLTTDSGQYIEVPSSRYFDGELLVFELQRKGTYYNLKVYARNTAQEGSTL